MKLWHSNPSVTCVCVTLRLLYHAISTMHDEAAFHQKLSQFTQKYFLNSLQNSSLSLGPVLEGFGIVIIHE